ncbi:alpha/beta hydrolase [Phenylobacterium deserti]|uniref:Alpha/beta hydrolase n=1 Tax=Phenylobacterium deserti TaxID=1914756 RepID=A0A328AH32_9CAUL|nr:alpha/beta hydrolase [Phenylobacterium deserti]RAK52168.1 alpha/beta hydrolase [Phenylobacterium deserti]
MLEAPFPRRTLLGSALAVAATPSLAKAAAPARRADAMDLWPAGRSGFFNPALRLAFEEHGSGQPPDRSLTGVGTALIQPVIPAQPNGAALLIIPGGSYLGEWFDREGFDVAERLALAGVTSFILRYRLPGEGWANRSEVSLQDAQRAIRLIRARADQWRLDPTKVGVMGFSAGGHLAANLSVRTTPAYDAIDATDRLPHRPDLAALMYPVIELTGPAAHKGSAEALLGPAPSADLVRRHTPSLQVSTRTPPTFVVHAMDDDLVPVENAFRQLSALRTVGVAGEGHIFQQGGHGFAVRGSAGKPVAAWPDLFLRWTASHGWPTS